jgi:putative FmdB family regulatory protein
MPTYEYECTKCGHNFERFQQMIDKPVDKCPKCGSKPKRLIGSGSGLIFKGPGFYATDYRKSSKPSAPVKPKTCPHAQEGCNGCKG